MPAAGSAKPPACWASSCHDEVVTPAGPPIDSEPSVAAPTELPSGAGRLQSLFLVAVKPLFSFCWRVHVEGMENLPIEGPAILAPNHTSVFDSFVLPTVLPRRITYVGKAEYLDDWKTRYIFPALGMIPIDRRGGNDAQQALDAAAGVLDRGGLFGIYPEGTRSRSGQLHKGHTGPARLALRTGAPIVPVGLIGTREIQPPDQPMPTPFRAVVVKFGRPVDPDVYAGRTDTRMVTRQMIDEVMFEIREMTGQTYVDTYATKKAPEPLEQAAPMETPAAPRRSSAELLRTAAR
ncbi:MAG: 1-acyl-sn-glycerol-3-phosphate acyltransferase [Actinomycetia bacterium]|nr:1-acyl-sn-glycerol-3-phosphate acyltransferase [Actinomycetes bacterium]